MRNGEVNFPNDKIDFLFSSYQGKVGVILFNFTQLVTNSRGIVSECPT